MERPPRPGEHKRQNGKDAGAQDCQRTGHEGQEQQGHGVVGGVDSRGTHGVGDAGARAGRSSQNQSTDCMTQGFRGAQAIVALNFLHQISTDPCLLRSIDAGIT